MSTLLKRIPGGKKKCQTMRCRDATASSFVAKVLSEVFAHFHAVALKVTLNYIYLLACQGEFFVKIPFISKEIYSMVLAVVLMCLAFPLCPVLSIQFKHPCTAHAFFPELLPNHVMVSFVLFECLKTIP
jgi:hypothetical protein